ncbi:hypothetical protein DFH11DRAFT_1632048, partial [Phellopilus nigrolimitatus]
CAGLSLVLACAPIFPSPLAISFSTALAFCRSARRLTVSFWEKRKTRTPPNLFAFTTTGALNRTDAGARISTV